jgi:hypothetical protein
VNKSRYYKFCTNPSARKDEGFTTGNGSHFFCGVENSGKDTVSTVTGNTADIMTARISTWKGAVELTAICDPTTGATNFAVSLVPHAGEGPEVYHFCQGIIGDKHSVSAAVQLVNRVTTGETIP